MVLCVRLDVHAAVGVLGQSFVSFTVVSQIQVMFEDPRPQRRLRADTHTPACSPVHASHLQQQATPTYLTVDVIVCFCYGQGGELDDELGKTHVLQQPQHLITHRTGECDLVQAVLQRRHT